MKRPKKTGQLTHNWTHSLLVSPLKNDCFIRAPKKKRIKNSFSQMLVLYTELTRAHVKVMGMEVVIRWDVANWPSTGTSDPGQKRTAVFRLCLEAVTQIWMINNSDTVSNKLCTCTCMCTCTPPFMFTFLHVLPFCSPPLTPPYSFAFYHALLITSLTRPLSYMYMYILHWSVSFVSIALPIHCSLLVSHLISFDSLSIFLFISSTPEWERPARAEHCDGTHSQVLPATI